MSRENVEVARRVLGAIDRQDLSRLTELVDPDIEWQSFIASLEGGVFRGHDGIRRYMTGLSESWATLRADVRDILDAGEVVIVVGRVHYRGKTSGVETDVALGWMFRFRDGKVLRARVFSEPSQALEAVGLSE